MPTPNNAITYEARPPFWVARFAAMACPCELLIATPHQSQAATIAQLAAQEVWRIEQKYSRYNTVGIVAAINNAQGKAQVCDDETRDLFIYAQQLFELSQGLFDISSGCLKDIWHFHHKTKTPRLPSSEELEPLLPNIGLQKAHLNGNALTLPAGMQIDFGGIGKEYAADKALQKIAQYNAGQIAPIPVLVNLGGDIVASKSLVNTPWRVGLSEGPKAQAITFTQGAVATSGISQRQWIIAGKSYSHILNPKTGYPVNNPPHSVTVAAPTCMQAGMLTTLIMLQGEAAEEFVAAEAIDCWINRV